MIVDKAHSSLRTAELEGKVTGFTWISIHVSNEYIAIAIVLTLLTII
jgi:hypothetical protein